MRWLRFAVVGLVLVISFLFLVGLARPEAHTASTRARYASAPDAVWQVVSDFTRWPEWNPEVHSVTRLPDRGGHTVIDVVGSWGAAATELTVFDPPAHLETRMDAGDFSGSWSYQLAPAPGGGTILTVTESGRVGSAFLRALMVFHDDHATMEAFHRALAARLGETVEPERLGAGAR